MAILLEKQNLRINQLSGFVFFSKRPLRMSKSLEGITIFSSPALPASQTSCSEMCDCPWACKIDLLSMRAITISSTITNKLCIRVQLFLWRISRQNNLVSRQRELQQFQINERLKLQNAKLRKLFFENIGAYKAQKMWYSLISVRFQLVRILFERAC